MDLIKIDFLSTKLSEKEKTDSCQ